LVGVAAAEALEGGFLVAEGGQEGEGEFGGIEGSFGELGDGFFDFDCVHSIPARPPRR
jgi:hypothetical protein